MTAEQSSARTFLKEHSLGVLATLSPDGAPRARSVYYAADDDCNIYFCTLAGTRKVADIAVHAQAAFVVSTSDAPQTVQLEGTITDLTETATITDEVRSLLDTLMEHGTHFAPLTHLDPGKVAFYKLTPTWIRFGDFTDGFGADKSFTQIPV